MKFPKTAAAVAALEKCQWKIGDALLAEIPAGQDAADVRGRLEDCAEELAKQGLEMSWTTLRDMRWVAANFPPSSRNEKFPWSTHRRAGTPEMLEAVTKVTGTKALTSERVSEAREVVQQREARQHRENQRATGVQRRPAPKFNRPKPIPQRELGGLRLLANVITQTNRLADARNNIEKAIEFVRDNLTKLDAEDTEAFTEMAFEIAKLGHKLGEVSQRLADRRKKHLSVVGE